MKFRRVPLAEAAGHILGHNVSCEGRRVLKKGRRLSAPELADLRNARLDGTLRRPPRAPAPCNPAADPSD